ncbi:MAG TPA: DUF5916 domain-containing protein [Longimicrobiales bacterium]|nr:DUF5916 domain-containing protein [Longimicrobiales bacterium]
MTRALYLVLLAGLAPGPAALAQSDGGEARVATAARTDAPPTVDGRLDEAAWAAAPLLDGFVQREPMQGSAVSERTEVRIVFDDRALYVGAWLYDSNASGIVYGETRRDADPGNVDAVLLVFDTYLDRQNGFLFATTPAGIEYDGQISKEGAGGFDPNRRQQTGSGGGFNVNWDGSWTVATTRDEAGWYAEFRIPFATLRYPGAGEQTWGLNVVRRIRRRNEEAFWSPVARQFDVYRVSDAGTLQGLEAPARMAVTVTPYVLGSARRDYTPADGPETTGTGDFGVDAKVVTASSLTLDLTYNTDFAQVEVDDEEVNLTRFRLFFPEKRPFFLENAGTFSVGTPQEAELFFSRRIGIEEGQAVPILGGGRLTGRVAGLTVGVLDIQTGEVEGLVTPNNFSVARVMKELPNRTRFGGAVVTRLNTDDTDDRNVVYAADGRLGIGESLTLDGYVAGSSTPGVTDDPVAFSGQVSWNSRDWEVGGTYRRIGEGFRAEAGFVPRGEHQFRSLRILRRIRFPDVTWFREMRPHVSTREYLSLDGFSETRIIHIDSHFEFANGAFFQLPALNFTREGLRGPFEISPGITLPAGTYDNFEWGFAFNTNLSAPLSAQGRVDVGGFYNGFRYGTTSTLNARVSNTFVASLRVSWFDVDLDQGDFRTTVVGLRTAYSFTPRIYLQSLLQYNDQSDTFSGNIRFAWLNTAGTGLFLVYNDLRNTASFAERGIPRGPLDRTFVVKFTRQLNLGD